MAYINGDQVLFSAQINGIVSIDEEMSETSENPVQNKAIKNYIDTTISHDVTIAVNENFNGRMVDVLTPEMGENNVGYIPTAGAVVNYVNGQTQGKRAWQHLTTVEFEVAQRQFLSDKFSESVGIKGVFAKIYVPKADSAVNITMRLLDADQNEKIRLQPQGYVSTSSDIYGQLRLEIVNGMWEGWWTNAQNSESAAWSSKYGLAYNQSTKTEEDLPFVYRIVIGAGPDLVLPAGTKMEVWVYK